jgi:hypothetical protein
MFAFAMSGEEVGPFSSVYCKCLNAPRTRLLLLIDYHSSFYVPGCIYLYELDIYYYSLMPSSNSSVLMSNQCGVNFFNFQVTSYKATADFLFLRP